MIINYGNKIVQTKIVYYGPAMSGKTTSLKNLFGQLKKEEELQSIETTTGRTLFFDFGILDFKGLEWEIKLYLYSTTGQDFYQSTRPATLCGVDGIVFIVDSQKSLIKYNKKSWHELRKFFKNKIEKIPIVICLNKYDLDDIIDPETLKSEFKINGKHNIEIIPSVAINGDGVKEAFSITMQKIFPNFKLEI